MIYLLLKIHFLPLSTSSCGLQITWTYFLKLKKEPILAGECLKSRLTFMLFLRGHFSNQPVCSKCMLGNGGWGARAGGPGCRLMPTMGRRTRSEHKLGSPNSRIPNSQLRQVYTGELIALILHLFTRKIEKTPTHPTRFVKALNEAEN